MFEEFDSGQNSPSKPLPFLPGISFQFPTADPYRDRYNGMDCVFLMDDMFNDHDHLESVKFRIAKLANVVLVFVTEDRGLRVIGYCGLINDTSPREYHDKAEVFYRYIIGNIPDLRLGFSSILCTHRIAYDANVYSNFDGHKMLGWPDLLTLINSLY